MQFKATGEVKINIAVLAYSNKLYGIAEIIYVLLWIKQSVIWGLH